MNCITCDGKVHVPTYSAVTGQHIGYLPCPACDGVNVAMQKYFNELTTTMREAIVKQAARLAPTDSRFVDLLARYGISATDEDLAVYTATRPTVRP